MLSLTAINVTKLVIVLAVSYFPVFTISGYFEAWVAKKFGDNTPDENGLLSWNPMDHFSILGFILLIFSAIYLYPHFWGFGRSILISKHNIRGKFKNIKYLIVLWARSFANIFLMCLSMLAWVVFVKFAVQPYNLEISNPSFMKSLGFLYVVFRRLNLVAAMLYLVSGFVRYIMSFIFPNIFEGNIFIILLVEIHLFLLSWEYIAPYLGAMVAIIEGLFGYLIGSLIG